MTDLLRMPYKKHDLPLAWLLSCQCVTSGWCYSGVQNQSTCRHLHNSNSLLTRFTASLLRHRDVAHDATRLIILLQVATIQHDILENYKFPTYFRSWMSSSVIISSAWWLFRWGFWWEGGWKPRTLAGSSILVTSASLIVALQYFSLPWEVWHSFPVGLEFPLFRTLLTLFSIRARPFGQIIHTTKRNLKYLSSWPFKRSACIPFNWTYWPDVWISIGPTDKSSPCVASVSVWFRSKERLRNGIFGFGRTRNETRAKNERGGRGRRRKETLDKPSILKTYVRQRTQRLIGSASRTILTCVD